MRNKAILSVPKAESRSVHEVRATAAAADSQHQDSLPVSKSCRLNCRLLLFERGRQRQRQQQYEHRDGIQDMDLLTAAAADCGSKRCLSVRRQHLCESVRACGAVRAGGNSDNSG
ncbi:hypothetical protein ACLKA6_009242 [Drosophila palustris]